MSHIRVYKNTFGEIPNGYEIHHLDINHNNNEPENLLALPKSIHMKYHFSLNFIKGDKTIDDIDRMIHFGSLDAYIKHLKRYQLLTKKLGALIVYRNQRLSKKEYKQKVQQLFPQDFEQRSGYS